MLKYAPHSWLSRVWRQWCITARRVHELGAGTRPIPRSRLTADNPAAAITEATTNHAMQEKAADLGAKIITEDGVSEVVSTIREFLETI